MKKGESSKRLFLLLVFAFLLLGVMASVNAKCVALPELETHEADCNTFTSKADCLDFTDSEGIRICEWIDDPSGSAGSSASLKSSVVDCDKIFEITQISDKEAKDEAQSKITQFTFKRIYCVWLGGYSSNEFSLSGEFIKWMFLLIVFLMVMSSLNELKFPESRWLRYALGIAVSLLGTFLITTPELLTAMQTYAAMSIALFIFLPFVILMGLSILVVKKANPFGILMQRILWLIFGIYMLVKTATLWVLMKSPACLGVGVGDEKCQGIFAGLFGWVLKELYNPKTLETMKNGVVGSGSDNLILILLIIVSIFTLSEIAFNDKIRSWFQNEVIESEADADKAELKRSRAHTQNRAEDIQNAGK